MILMGFALDSWANVAAVMPAVLSVRYNWTSFLSMFTSWLREDSYDSNARSISRFAFSSGTVAIALVKFFLALAGFLDAVVRARRRRRSASPSLHFAIQSRESRAKERRSWKASSFDESRAISLLDQLALPIINYDATNRSLGSPGALSGLLTRWRFMPSQSSSGPPYGLTRKPL